MSKIGLSISLVRESVTTLDGILRDTAIHSCNIENVGTLYYKNSSKNQAHRIQDFFGDRLPIEDAAERRKPILFTAVVQAVLIVKRCYEGVDRYFIVTFGLGRSLIKTDCIQEKFGMLVVLNSINPETIRSVDVNVLESVPKQDRIQLTKTSKISSFNLNPEQDLLRALTGKTKNEYKDILGTTVTGADTLKISIDIHVDELPAKLDKIYELSTQTTYRDNFGFIDKISPIKDHNLRNTLNDNVIQRLNDRQLDLVWLSIPELVNWEDVNAIRYSPSGVDYYDLDINAIISDTYFDEPVDIDALSNRHVYAYNPLGFELGHWSVYRCLCSEVEIDENQYILSNGQWYLIDRAFAQSVNDFYNQFELSELHLEISRYNEVEGDYNKRVANSDINNRLLMDKRLIRPSQGLDPIEFCDIYTTNKELIHIKRYSGSATLSHLFNQGLVSAELLMQKEFRKILNEEFDVIGREQENRVMDAWKVQPIERDFHRDDYRIIFAIITEAEDERPSIPFFSKVTFRQVCSRLQDYGYHVSLMKINVDPNDDANPELTRKRMEQKRRNQARRNH